MKSLLTYGNSIHNILNYYDSIASGSSIYFFLGKIDEWTIPALPDDPILTNQAIKNIHKNIFISKKIYPYDISGVIERIDWTSGVTYDYYIHNYDMFAKDIYGKLLLKFYAKNRFDQVFKCLWNGGIASTVEPIMEPGLYDNNLIVDTGDGYKWKYVYTINKSQKYKFTDTNFIPVSGKKYTAPIESGLGAIELINIVSGGFGYANGSNTTSVSINGDGTGFSGSVYISDNAIDTITINNGGSNFTHANVIITPIKLLGGCSAFVEANVFASIGTIFGSTNDPITELGCQNITITCSINGTEDLLNANTEFRQHGLIYNQQSNTTWPYAANSALYDHSTKLLISNIGTNYHQNERVYQGSNISNTTFVGSVLNFDSSNNILSVINMSGAVSTNVLLKGNTSGTERVVLQTTTPDIILGSGYITQYTNDTKKIIAVDGSEMIRLRLTI